MTRVLIGKDLVLEGSTTKIEDKQVPGIYIYISTWTWIIIIIGSIITSIFLWIYHKKLIRSGNLS